MIRFEDNLGIHLFKAYFSIYKYLKKTFSDHQIENMNPTRLGILLALADQDGVIMSKLGQRLFLEKSTMTGVIDKMEAEGYRSVIEMGNADPDGIMTMSMFGTYTE